MLIKDGSLKNNSDFQKIELLFKDAEIQIKLAENLLDSIPLPPINEIR